MSSAATVPAGNLARDIRVMSLVGTAHGFSHFFQMVIPTLFFLMKDALGVSFIELALLTTVFYVVSGVSQTAAGFVVDHFGAGRILIGGLGLFSAMIALSGFVPNFWSLVPLMAIAALGNSVFHPADFAVLNGNVHASRLGRAYGVHGILGNIGWAAASGASLGLGFLFGWRVALVVLGSVGLAVTAYLFSQRRYLTTPTAPVHAVKSASEGLRAGVGALLAPAVLTCFAYFVLISMALIGLQNFGANILAPIYQVSFEHAALAVTLFLSGGAVGVLVGGWLADRTRQHAWVAGTGMALAAVFTLLVAAGTAPPLAMLVLLSLAGFALGCTNPSRDMLVRSATPPGSSGKVFGFVYSGLDLGSCTAPLLFGWMLDQGLNQAVLILMAAFMLLTIATIVGVRAHAHPPRLAQPAE